MLYILACPICWMIIHRKTHYPCNVLNIYMYNKQVVSHDKNWALIRLMTKWFWQTILDQWGLVMHICITWWRHKMETFSALLAICAGNSPVTGEFPAQRPVTRSFDVFFDLRPTIRLSKQSWGWRFQTPSHPLWRHCNEHWKPRVAMMPTLLSLMARQAVFVTDNPWCSIVTFGFRWVKWAIIGSGNGLSPVRRQAITWTNDDLSSTATLVTQLSDICIQIHTLSLKEM